MLIIQFKKDKKITKFKSQQMQLLFKVIYKKKNLNNSFNLLKNLIVKVIRKISVLVINKYLIKNNKVILKTQMTELNKLLLEVKQLDNTFNDKIFRKNY